MKDSMKSFVTDYACREVKNSLKDSLLE